MVYNKADTSIVGICSLYGCVWRRISVIFKTEKRESMNYYDTFNHVLVKLFRDIQDVEERALTRWEFTQKYVCCGCQSVCDGRNSDHCHQ